MVMRQIKLTQSSERMSGTYTTASPQGSDDNDDGDASSSDQRDSTPAATPKHSVISARGELGFDDDPLSVDGSGELKGFLFKKYAFRRKLSTGWHKRYFVLKGNRLDYFKDHRMRKLRGSVQLGSGCLVDFPRTTTVRAGREVYPFSIFTEDSSGGSHQQVLMKSALLLGCPNLEHASEWVMALQLAIHTQSQKNLNIGEGGIKDMDDEEDDDNEEDVQGGNFDPIAFADGSKLWVRKKGIGDKVPAQAHTRRTPRNSSQHNAHKQYIETQHAPSGSGQ
jgi:hypothetical protein